MENVKVFADRQKDTRTNGQAQSYMPPIYRCGGYQKFPLMRACAECAGSHEREVLMLCVSFLHHEGPFYVQIRSIVKLTEFYGFFVIPPLRRRGGGGILC